MLSVAVVAFNHGDFNDNQGVVGAFAGRLMVKVQKKQIFNLFFCSIGDCVCNLHSLLRACFHGCGDVNSRNKQSELKIRCQSFIQN